MGSIAGTIGCTHETLHEGYAGTSASSGSGSVDGEWLLPSVPQQPGHEDQSPVQCRRKQARWAVGCARRDWWRIRLLRLCLPDPTFHSIRTRADARKRN